MGLVYQHAPLAMNIFTEKPADARKVAKYMLDNYGKQDEDGQYPRLPDGSRTRFLPASKYLDMTRGMTAKNLMKNQIQFNRDQVRIPVPLLKPPSTKFKEHGDKTLTELILDLKCQDMNNEPYFRHLVKQWTKDPTEKRYQVSIHAQMAEKSSQILIKLYDVLYDKYGGEVASCVPRYTQEEQKQQEDKMEETVTISTLSLDTNDRYANSSAKTIIEGMEALNTSDTAPTLADQKQAENDNYTMSVNSEGTDRTNETSRTMDAKGQEAIQNNQEAQATAPNQPYQETNITGTPRDPNKEDEWQRVGSKEDEQNLPEPEPEPDRKLPALSVHINPTLEQSLRIEVLRIVETADTQEKQDRASKLYCIFNSREPIRLYSTIAAIAKDCDHCGKTVTDMVMLMLAIIRE